MSKIKLTVPTIKYKDKALQFKKEFFNKAELFGKVRSGQVRFLLGSTQKMGAETLWTAQ